MQQKQGPQRAEGKETLSGKGQISVQHSAETPNTKPHLNKLLLLSPGVVRAWGRRLLLCGLQRAGEALEGDCS